MWSGSKLQEGWSAPATEPDSRLESAVAAFAGGDPVLIHDSTDRENEIDLVYPAHAVTPADVSRLRNDAGGLICVALSADVADAFGLSYLDEVIDHPAGEGVDLGYDDRSSFSITVNHRDTYTGITDNDRSKTIAALGEAARDPDGIDFAAEFDAPGHVHLLKAAPGLLENRRGHTELGVALARLADVPPAVVVCEMLDDDTGGALSRSNAASYAGRNGYVFLDGSTIADELRGG